MAITMKPWFNRSQGFTLIEMMIILMIVGLLAAISIPAYIKHVKQSKTVEAVDSLDRIKSGAEAYFENERFDDTGNRLPRTFPAHLQETPAGGPELCCNTKGSLCVTGVATWIRRGWNALQFSISEPHSYTYEFVGGNADTRAYYNAYAYGDLDCDGIRSTFEIKGSVDSQGKVNVRGPVITRGIE
jgi:prepilin-type N-terminal cleavage/methylation domain-containing protein